MTDNRRFQARAAARSTEFQQSPEWRKRMSAVAAIYNQGSDAWNAFLDRVAARYRGQRAQTRQGDDDQLYAALFATSAEPAPESAPLDPETIDYEDIFQSPPASIDENEAAEYERLFGTSSDDGEEQR